MENLGNDIILKSAELRAQFNFDGAIQLIQSNIEKIHPDIIVNAWLEAFYAAKEKGDVGMAKKFATEIAKNEPKLPSIQSYL